MTDNSGRFFGWTRDNLVFNRTQNTIAALTEKLAKIREANNRRPFQVYTMSSITPNRYHNYHATKVSVNSFKHLRQALSCAARLKLANKSVVIRAWDDETQTWNDYKTETN